MLTEQKQCQIKEVGCRIGVITFNLKADIAYCLKKVKLQKKWH